MNMEPEVIVFTSACIAYKTADNVSYKSFFSLSEEETIIWLDQHFNLRMCFFSETNLAYSYINEQKAKKKGTKPIVFALGKFKS